MLARLALFAGLCALLAAPAIAIEETDVLNFALNLEYLEANFYKCARDGTPLDDSDTGGGKKPLGCKKAKNLDWQSRYLLNQIAEDEINHVKFLRAALGDKAVKQPLIDIGPAFAAAANAVANTTLSPAFSPYTNALYFLHGAFIFEDVGVTAYHGGLRALTTDAYRQAAEGIMAVEAYHAGAVRLALQNAGNKDTGYGIKVRPFVAAIAKTRDAIDCKKFTKQDAGLEDLAPADKNGIAFLRNTDGVLKIVYLGGTTKGGFFPEGVNGVINKACA